MKRRPSLLPLCLATALVACRGGDGERARPAGSATTAPAGSASAAPPASAAVPVRVGLRAPAREGSTIACAPGGDALYVADEDLGRLDVVALPFTASTRPLPLTLPGQPAQVLALADRVLVTIRSAGAPLPGKIVAGEAAPTPPGAEASDAAPAATASSAASAAPPAASAGPEVPSATGPGLLLSFRRDPDRGLVETARVELPQDAWGIAVTPDGSMAIVTSAWTHQVTAVDLGTDKVLWSVSVAREPRAVVVRADGRAAYVTHLTGTALTRLDNLAGPPKVHAVAFPPSPLRTPLGVRLGASLAYAAALSPDGRRLFVPRHALGALGSKAWFGAATVDVLLTGDDTPQAPYRREGIGAVNGDVVEDSGQGYFESDPMGPGRAPAAPPAPFAQPRAVAYLEKRAVLLVAGEGSDSLVELDARAVDPAMVVLATHGLAQGHEASIHVATKCGAPSGIAVSADEQTAWVHCRSTRDLVAVAVGAQRGPEAPVLMHLGDDVLPAEAALGRRLFYNATDSVTSGGLGCAGCHPDGRDDGHVWRETTAVPPARQQHPNFVSSPDVLASAKREDDGFTRQTPMLAGRVAAEGPYGWHGESPTLSDRLRAGFRLHRWDEPGVSYQAEDLRVRASALQAFLRAGLVPPPHQERELSAREKRGRDLFLGDETACWTCHPAPEYTNRKAYPVFPDATAPEVVSLETQAEYKTPSLRFVGGTPPYLHDGRFATLAALLAGNDDHMGKTNQLSAADKAALVAFLETL